MLVTILHFLLFLAKVVKRVVMMKMIPKPRRLLDQGGRSSLASRYLGGWPSHQALSSHGKVVRSCLTLFHRLLTGGSPEISVLKMTYYNLLRWLRLDRKKIFFFIFVPVVG